MGLTIEQVRQEQQKEEDSGPSLERIKRGDG
jgi:hypothetical protein